MIAVCIATYNHEHFIAQAIESVLMQECDEPIRIYIGDDASSDGTAAICSQYAKKDKRIIFIKANTNKGLVDNTLSLYRRILADHCDYIAMLDGDDFWVNKHKLQLQINYLRTHQDVGFVHTNGSTLSGAKIWEFGQREGVYGIDSVGFANCTVMFRANLLSENLLQQIEAQHFMWLDYPLYGVFYQHTKWAYLPQKTAVWRDHISVSQPKAATDILSLREEKCRMWKWLDTCFPGEVGYDSQVAHDFLLNERLNLIYAFADHSLTTQDLLHDFHPHSWKQSIKLLGIKHRVLFPFIGLFTQKCN